MEIVRLQGSFAVVLDDYPAAVNVEEADWQNYTLTKLGQLSSRQAVSFVV